MAPEYSTFSLSGLVQSAGNCSTEWEDDESNFCWGHWRDLCRDTQSSVHRTLGCGSTDRRFPDFIFLQRNGTYAFVESKAFTGNRSVKSHPLEKVPRTEMQECILNAVQQLNADPFIAVWYAFTEIQNIDPIEVSVIFLELTASSGTKDSKKCRFLPEALRKGLAERAVSSATASLEDSAHGQLFSASANRQKEQLFDVAAEESRRLIRTTVPETLQADALDSIAKEAKKIAAKLKASPSDEGKRLEAAKKMVAEGRLGTLRSTPSGTLYLVDLTEEQLAKRN